MTHRDFHRARSGGSGRLLPLLALAATVPLAACDLDRVLDVNDPEVATPGSLTGKSALPTILAGALGDFAVAYSGSNGGNPVGIGNEGLVNFSGLLADEFLNTETFTDRIDIDSRQIQHDNGSLDAVMLSAQRARASADRGVERFAEFDPNTTGHATVLNLSGLMYVLLGENFCSGVPTSSISDAGSITYGEQEDTDQMWARAIARFDAALAITAASADQQNLAKVGKGRALLNAGDRAGAAAAVAGVPLAFNFVIDHTTNTIRQNNGVFAFSTQQERWGVPQSEGTNGLNFQGAGDPRVQSMRTPATNVGFDGVTPIFFQQKYTNESADALVASGLEAELIRAENLLATSPAAWLTALNTLRAAPPAYTGVTAPLAPLADPGSPTARENLHFRERAFWLYLTAHRLGDLRRLTRDYSRGAETVFPTGSYHKGGVYGSDTSLPITIGEDSNPNFAGCLPET
ncbi:MAG: hypothetical protein ACREON_16920 [Gemmatimonadaceae bacterium]